jgi:hypothetical protein
MRHHRFLSSPTCSLRGRAYLSPQGQAQSHCAGHVPSQTSWHHPEPKEPLRIRSRTRSHDHLPTVSHAQLVNVPLSSTHGVWSGTSWTPIQPARPRPDHDRRSTRGVLHTVLTCVLQTCMLSRIRTTAVAGHRCTRRPTLELVNRQPSSHPVHAQSTATSCSTLLHTI